MIDVWSTLEQFISYNISSPLIFTEGSFWVFFTILILGYSFAYKTNALRSLYLLVFSLFFYYKASGYFFTLLLFSTFCDYVLGILIYRTCKQWKKKGFLALSIIINLGLLSFFKYSYFFADTINNLAGTSFRAFNFLSHWSNELTGTSFDVSSIILPVGISFYTFQTISYSVDVYREKVKPVSSIIDFGFYVSFFPQLVAGPIVRAAEFIPQLYRKYSLSSKELGHAIFLIINGLVKKIVISDYISLNFVDRVFENPLSYSGFENLLATYGYTVQIYCDFSGYTDMAIGIALLLGFRLPINFNSPYKATNITDFWRRWHISLSSWLRDYLYIPMGGSKKGTARTYINLMITMLLGGLWHGANLRFIVWGGIHGISLALHRLWLHIFPKKAFRPALWKRLTSAFITFHLVGFSWIFFRAESFSKANQMINQIFNRFGWVSIEEMFWSYKLIIATVTIALTIHWLPFAWKEQYRGLFIRTPLYVKIIFIVIISLVILQIKSTELQPFIYFRF